MPAPAIQTPTLAQTLPLPATTAANSVTLPVRVGARPFTSGTKGKRPVHTILARNIAAATAPGTAAPFGIFGCEIPQGTSRLDSNGRVIPSIDPTSGLDYSGSTVNGGYIEKIKVSGGSGTGFGPIIVLNGGSGYDPTSLPTITITGGGSAAATAIVSKDGRVVGAILTNAGTYATSATVSISAPAVGGTQAALALTPGSVTTVNTHIPYAANASTTDNGAIWFAIWRDRIIAGSSLLVGATQGQPTAAILGTIGLDPDQHVLGLTTAPGFTVATGTHPDGTTTIGVLTLGVGIPNGDTITVVRGRVRQLVPPSVTMGITDLDTKSLDVMWLGGNATAGATETSVISCFVNPKYN